MDNREQDSEAAFSVLLRSQCQACTNHWCHVGTASFLPCRIGNHLQNASGGAVVRKAYIMVTIMLLLMTIPSSSTAAAAAAAAAVPPLLPLQCPGELYWLPPGMQRFGAMVTEHDQNPKMLCCRQALHARATAARPERAEVVGAVEHWACPRSGSSNIGSYFLQQRNSRKTWDWCCATHRL